MSPVPALERAVLALRSRPAAVVLIDGRSGSGKTTFATALAHRTGTPLLHLEDVYPGWDGLTAASIALVDHLLLPRSRGAPGSLQRWDWGADRADGVRWFRPAGPLVVEGCGSLSRRSSALADLRIWVELPEAARRSRALLRDGDAYAPHWERWARQERAAAARESPRTMADLIVDGREVPQVPPSDRSADPHYPRRP